MAMSRKRWISLTLATQTRHGRCAGFSALELVVVLAVISIMLGLLMPALLSARARARQATCQNNLRQIGIALESFESAQRRYPAARQSMRTRTGHVNSISAHVLLLPYLDHSNLYEEYDHSEGGHGSSNEPPTSLVNAELLSTPVSVYQCPDDPLGLPRNNYRICGGTSPGQYESIPRDRPGAALQGFRSWQGRFDAQFKDGKSQTAAFAEKLASDREPESFSPWRDLVAVPTVENISLPDDVLRVCSGPIDHAPRHASFGGYTWVLSGYVQTWYNHVLTPNSRIPDCVLGGGASRGPVLSGGTGAYTARSLHPGGVNVLFADGATRFVSDSVDLGIWRAVGTVDGGEVVGDF